MYAWNVASLLHDLRLSSLADRHELPGGAKLRLQRRHHRQLPPSIAPSIAELAHRGVTSARPGPPPDVLTAGAAVIRELMISEAAAALGHAEIRVVVLKGPSIGRWLYGRSSERSYGDSDLLVAPADVPSAEKVIVSLGYRRLSEFLTGDRPWEALYWMRPHDGAALDLHRTLPGVEVSPDAAWLLLSTQTEGMTLRGVEIEFLNQPARALHLALHAADHGFTSDRPLRELALAVEALPEDLWSRAASLAAKLEATDAFAAGLRLICEGAELAARLLLPDNDSIEVALRASPASRHALGLEWLLQARGPGAKASLLIRKLAPPPAYMRAWSRLAQKGGACLILAYAWRPLYLLIEAPATVQSWARARRGLRKRRT